MDLGSFARACQRVRHGDTEERQRVLVREGKSGRQLPHRARRGGVGALQVPPAGHDPACRRVGAWPPQRRLQHLRRKARVEADRERQRLRRRTPLALERRQPLADQLVHLEAEEEQRPHPVRVRHLPPRLRVDPPRRLTHRLQRGPGARSRQQPPEEVAAARLVDEIRVPPPEPAGFAAAFAGPRDRQLVGEDGVEDALRKRCRHPCRGCYARGLGWGTGLIHDQHLLHADGPLPAAPPSPPHPVSMNRPGEPEDRSGGQEMSSGTRAGIVLPGPDASAT